MNCARPTSYHRHRFPREVMAQAVWLYYRFPLSLRMVEEMLASRGIEVTYETIRRWADKFGRDSPALYGGVHGSPRISGTWTRL